MTPTGLSIPAGACDCHTHVFPDDPRFPFAASRRYTPPFAGVQQLQSLLDTLRIERVVIVQPSVYGSDNAATLHAVHRLGQQRARAVAVIDDAATDSQLDAFHLAGVRGVRLNLEMLAESDPSRCKAIVKDTAARVAGRGWHIQVYSRLELIGSIADVFGALDLPVVFDHFARARAPLGLLQPGLRAVLELVRAGHAFVKLSAPYLCSDDAPCYADLDAIAHALIDANPARMLWASNWPHPNPGHAQPSAPAAISPAQQVDDRGVLALLARWAPDATVRQQILADNPASLYGFAEALTSTAGPGHAC
jgi:predicted TIM-barrel fold metal-dependent hydrolase